VDVVVLLLASMAMFISLIHRIGMLQVNRMLVVTGDQGRKIIAFLYPPSCYGANRADNLIRQVHAQKPNLRLCWQ
jgi:hypothetical protein